MAADASAMSPPDSNESSVACGLTFKFHDILWFRLELLKNSMLPFSGLLTQGVHFTDFRQGEIPQRVSDKGKFTQGHNVIVCY